MLNPSSEWTETERLEIIKAKAREFADALQADHQHRINRVMVRAFTEQLHLLTRAPAETLEVKREELLVPVLLLEVRPGRTG